MGYQWGYSWNSKKIWVDKKHQKKGVRLLNTYLGWKWAKFSFILTNGGLSLVKLDLGIRFRPYRALKYSCQKRNNKASLLQRNECMKTILKLAKTWKSTSNYLIVSQKLTQALTLQLEIWNKLLKDSFLLE